MSWLVIFIDTFSLICHFDGVFLWGFLVYFFAATDTPNESMEVGEEDDPEFNYIAEAETEEIEAEEVRFDGPFRVTRMHFRFCSLLAVFVSLLYLFSSRSAAVNFM